MYKKNIGLKNIFKDIDKEFIQGMYKNDNLKAILLSSILFLLQIVYILIFDMGGLYKYNTIVLGLYLVNIVCLLVSKSAVKDFASEGYSIFMFFYLLFIIGNSIYLVIILNDSYHLFTPVFIAFTFVMLFIQIRPVHTIVLTFITNVSLIYFLPVYGFEEIYYYTYIVSFMIFSIILLCVNFVIFLSAYEKYVILKTFKMRNAELSELSAKDSLTGLYNHKYGIERLEEEISRRNRTNNDLVILLFDVDDFKGVNDGYGHIVGDSVLEYIGGTIRHNIRITDVAIRYGGDEFMIIFPYANLKDVMGICRKLIYHFEKYSLGMGDGFSISGGLVEHDLEKAEELINRADTCLYKAKSQGKNKIIYEINNEYFEIQ